MNVATTKETIFCTKQDMKIEPIETVDNLKYLGREKRRDYAFKEMLTALLPPQKTQPPWCQSAVLRACVYKPLAESVLMFHFPVWFGHMTCRNENKLCRIVSVANKIAGKLQKSLSCILKGQGGRWHPSSPQPV